MVQTQDPALAAFLKGVEQITERIEEQADRRKPKVAVPAAAELARRINKAAPLPKLPSIAQTRYYTKLRCWTCGGNIVRDRGDLRCLQCNRGM